MDLRALMKKTCRPQNATNEKLAKVYRVSMRRRRFLWGSRWKDQQRQSDETI